MSGCYKRVNFYDLCRLCAQNIQKNKIKIFEQDGHKNQLQSKIKKCLSINVKEDDFLPKVICSKCIKQLEICNAFREECLNSETMLSSYFKNYRHTEDFKKSGKVYIKDTVKSETTNEQTQCTNKKTEQLVNGHPTNPNQIAVLQSSSVPQSKPDVCSKNINSQLAKNQNLPNKKLKVQDTFPQVQAMQLPYSIDMINEALKKAVQQLPKEILNKVIVNSNGEVINLSPQDSLSIETPQMPQTMISGVTSVIKNKSSKSKESVKQLKVPNSMNQNIIKIDLTDDDNIEEVPTNKYSAVPYCKNNQNNVQPSVQNPTVIFPVPQYQNNNFASVPTNNIYPQQTTVSIPSSNPTVINVICSTTPEQTVPVSSINHTAPSSINMEDLRPSQNYISPTTTPTKSVKTEAGKNTVSPKVDDLSKMHACEVCSKTFKRREHLYQHIKLHTGFRPYQCTECKKSFVRKEHLLRHMVLHSGERNFSCDICNKSFSRHDNLLKHIRTHNKEPTYTCDVCQKVFIIKHYYDSHRSEHGKCYLPPHLRSC